MAPSLLPLGLSRSFVEFQLFQDIVIARVKKWLHKDFFVRVTIEAHGKKKEGQDLQVKD